MSSFNYGTDNRLSVKPIKRTNRFNLAVKLEKVDSARFKNSLICDQNGFLARHTLTNVIVVLVQN